MRTAIPALGIAAAMCLVSTANVDACGDKSLRIGRGARFQRTAHQARVLIYVPAPATVDAGAKASGIQSVALSLQGHLRKSGHKSLTVSGTDQLFEAIKAGMYDVVLIDLAEAGALHNRIEGSASKPAVVPVACKETKAQVASSKKQYAYLVKNFTSGDQYLDAIDEVMRSRKRVVALNP